MTGDPNPAATGTAGEQSRRPPRRRVQVRRVQRLTPRVVSVTFHGEELEGFDTAGAGAHLKVFFPPPGQREVVLPPPGPDGRPDWGDRPAPAVRTYTPRRFDPGSLELDVEFVIHGDGPAARWAAGAAEGGADGQVLVVAGPRGGHRVDPEAEWYLVLADEPAIPAACTLLEALPATTHVRAFLEVPDAAEERPLGRDEGIEVTWLHRGHDDRAAGALLERAIRECALPPGQGHIWVACEAEAMRRIRLHLLRDRGLDRTTITTRGYWKLGAVDHPDHDYGEDVD